MQNNFKTQERINFYIELSNKLNNELGFSKNQTKKLNSFIRWYSFDKNFNVIRTVKDTIYTILNTNKNWRLKWVSQFKYQQQQEQKKKKRIELAEYFKRQRINNLDNILSQLKKDIEDAVLYNGFIVEASNKNLINTRIEALSNYINNPEYYSSGKLNSKILKLKPYLEPGYNSFNFEAVIVQYPYPLSIFLLNFNWSSIENAYIQLYLANRNEYTTGLEYSLYSVFDYIDKKLNPDYPIVSPRTKHGVVDLFRQDLVTLDSIYEKTSTEFKNAIKEAKNYFIKN